MKQIALNSTLQPLSEATKTALTPPRLKSSDHLYLVLDPDHRHFIAEVKCLDDEGNEAYWPGVSYGAREFFQRIPECRRPKAEPGKWILGATDFTALLIHHCWPTENIHFQARLDLPESEVTRQRFEYLLLRFAAQNGRAELQAKFKITGEMPNLPKDWMVHPDLPLEDYQTVAALFCRGHEGTGLLMDRGTGKTAAAAVIISQNAALKQDGMYRVLIVAPKQVMLNWKEEMGRFATVPGKVVIMRGGAAKRVKALVQGITPEDDCQFGAVIINYDSARQSIDQLDKVPWDLVIADESQRFKSASTGRWKTMQRLREASDQRLALTGSPIGNSPMDLWTQLEFLGQGMSGFTSFRAFRSFYGKWASVSGAPGIQKLVGLQNMVLLQERLARSCFQITKEEAGLNLPDKVYDVREVEMTESQADYYKMACEQLALELKDAHGVVQNEMSVQHILTKLLRLAQITSGFVTWDAVVDPETGVEMRKKKIQQINHRNPKIEMVLDDIIEELQEDPRGKKIIWAIEVESLKRIYERLQERFEELGTGWECGLYYGGTSEEDRIQMAGTSKADFNANSNFKVMVANPMAAGEGLDLLGYDKTLAEDAEDNDCYVDHELFFSQNWSALLRVQAEDRAHRRGTRVPVRITDYITTDPSGEPTIDAEIRGRVQGKTAMAKMVIDIQDILTSVLNW